MYYATYGAEYLHDPFSEDQVVSDLTITGKVNAQGSCDFTIAPSHPLYDKLKIRDLSEPVRVYEDSICLFDGYIYQVEDQFDKSRNVSCNGSLSYLGDSIVRPYATVKHDDDQPGMLYSGSSVAGLFSWYIDQHNQHTDSIKHFIVGKNEGSQLDTNDKIYRSNTNYPTTSSEIEDKLLNSLGGYLFTRYENDTRYIDYFADCVDVNAQVIDFGVNITDYTKSDTSESMYTVLIPQGATPESKDNSNTKQYPIDIKSIPDGPTSVSGIYKSGDHLYDKDGVDKYGMIEKFETFSDIYEPENLLKAAALSLKTQSTPVTKIEVKAVDLSLYMDNYKPLIPGQLVRIRSLPHNIDTYMLLSEMSIDVEDPSNTTYTFGITYDTLTGQQSKRIQELNSSINSSLDAVASIDQVTKDTAIAVGVASKTAEEAKNTANTAKDTADTAKNTADTANTTANNAQSTANTAKNTADKAQTTATEASKTATDAKAVADSANKAAEELKKKTAEIDKQVEAASNAADAASAKADQVRTDLTNQVQNVKSEMDTAVEAAQTSANKAQSAADAAQKAADKANASTADLDKSIKAVDAKAIAAKQAAAEAQSKAENVASDLDSANAVIEQHTTELGELTTKVSNAVKKSDSALSVSTEAKQTATEASTTATSAYKDSQTALTQSTTATQTATAAKTTAESASKTATDSLKQSSAAVQTANQISTTLRTEYQTKADADKLYATQSSLKQTSDSITASVSKTYATKDALSALQNVADNAIESWRGTGVPTLENKPASDWTTNDDKKKHSGDLYYDKSTGKAYRFGSDDGVTYTWELNQDTDVTKALKDAANAQTSANTAQASATAANTAAGKAQSTANTAVSNAATAKNAADAAQSSANKAQGDVNKLKIDIPETYATKSSLSQTAESITANVESVKTTANSAVTAASKAQQTADGISVNLTKNYQTKSQADTIYATKANLKATSDSISAEVTKAQGTADGAVTAASKAQQTADAVTLNLSKNYQTKAQNDALYATQTSLKATSDSLSANITANAKTAQSAVDKATSLEANLNGFKTTVSDTYMAKGIGDEIIENGIPNPDRPNKFGLEIVDGVFQRTFPGKENHVDYGPYEIMHTIGPHRMIRIAIDVRLVSGKDTVSDMDEVRLLGTDVGWAAISIHLKDIVDGEWHSYEMYQDLGTGTVTRAYASSYVGSEGVKVLQFRNASIKDVTSEYKTYSTKSELTQTANSIKAQVTEVSKTANSAMTKATTVEQTANGLSSKITEQGKTLNATVKTANEAKSTADSNKATISQVSTTASSALTKASTVEQNLNGFKTTVSETYTTKTDFNNLSVGGTNLIPDSKELLKGDFSYSFLNRAQVSGTIPGFSGFYFRGNSGVKSTNDSCSWTIHNCRPGDRFTFSFYCGAYQTNKIRTYFYGPSGYMGAKVIASIDHPSGYGNGTYSDGNCDHNLSASNGNGKFIWVTYECDPNYKGSVTDKYILIRTDPSVIGSNIWIAKPKMERGTKPTDWSPAPEDLQPAGDYSTKSYVDQTAKSVALGVVQNYKGSDGSGLATKSDITASEKSITSTVSKTYQTKEGMSNYVTQSQIQQTNDKVTIAFQNSQSVGGQNLLLKTSVPSIVTGSGGENQNGGAYSLAVGNLSNLPVGMYHLQFKIKSDTAGGTAHPQWNANPWNIPNANAINIGTSEQTYSINCYISNNNYPGVTAIRVRLDNAKGNVTIREMKLERGNSMTPWTAAPEDTINNLSDSVQDQAGQIHNKADSSILEQYKNDTDNKLNSTNSKVSDLNEAFNADRELRGAYIQFGSDITSNPYMDMGNPDSPNKMHLTNSKMSFMSNDAEVAYISDKQLMINNAQVINDFRIGNFIWTKRADGHTSFKYDPK